jgi:SAM-dependent methyltransferase
MTEWFEEWFGEEYLQLYPHRDQVEADRAVALILGRVGFAPGWRVLDVACGAGRHARAFEAAGARCVGLDLSAALLRVAQGVTGAPLVRADMRALPIRPGAMDLTVNLFTSFGYFARDAEHAAVVAGVAHTLRPGGHLVLDFLNADTVRAAVARDEASHAPPQGTAVRRLSDDGRFVLKTIRIPADRTYTERVRLLAPGDLARMFRRAGLVVEHTFGDYDGRPLEPGTPRAILVGRAP